MNIINRIVDFLFRPFYRWHFWPLHVKFIRHPIRSQFQFLHYRWFSAIRKETQEVDIHIDKLDSFKLICNGSLCSHQMDLIMSGVYEERISSIVLANVEANQHFIDVGANIGYYSLLISSVPEFSGEVLSFEPVKMAYRMLQQNIELNNRVAVRSYNCALGDSCEEKYINLYRKLGHSSFADRHEKIISVKREKVQVNRFDDLQSYTQENVLIKIDVEGFEYEVLKGMRDLLCNNKCKIIMELTPYLHKRLNEGNTSYSIECLTYLIGLGFSLFQINMREQLEIKDCAAFLNKFQGEQAYIYAINY